MNARAALSDVSEGDHADFDWLRCEIRKCFSVEMPRSSSEFGDFRNVRGEMDLKNPRQCYTFIGKDSEGRERVFVKVKPQHDQWATTTHATATQKPGFSRAGISERDYSNSKYAKAIGRLQSHDIQIIHALYHSSASMRDSAQKRLAQYLATRHHRDERAQYLARTIAILIMKGIRSEPLIRGYVGISKEVWYNSYARDVFRNTAARIRQRDQAALLAWDTECLNLSSV